jgi:predicted TIM-barrel fold metal-dependent hydrolase
MKKRVTGRKNKKGMERRDFLKYATAAAAVGMTSLIPGRKTPEAESKEGGPGSVKRGKKTFKVIDFRCRPPLKSFGGLFKMRQGYIAKRPTVLANPATHGEVPRSVKLFGKPGAMEQWWREIGQTGIGAVVVAGRYMKGQPDMSMGYEDLLLLEKKYSGRFYGIAPINIDQPISKAVKELEVALKAGIRGTTIEPGYRIIGGPTCMDNADFYPIYEIMQDSGRLLQVQTGAFAAPDNWDLPNQIWRMDSVMKKFPKLRLVLGHGGYPRITEALALALKWPSVTISSDVYTFWPGGQLYQQNIELLQDQFVYGSAYPFGNFDTTLQQTLALPLSDKVMEKYLYLNAQRLLNLT